MRILIVDDQELSLDVLPRCNLAVTAPMNCPLAMLRILPSRSPTWQRHGGTCRLTMSQSWVGRALAVTVFYRCTSATLMAIS